MVGFPQRYPNRDNRWMLCSVFFSFFLIELFAFVHLQDPAAESESQLYWPLAFGALWALILGSVVRLLTWKAGRVLYGVLFFLSFAYAVGQTGYYQFFHEMMWLSEFRYASEGSDYLDVLLSFPLGWYLGIFGLLALGIITLWKFPRWRQNSYGGAAAIAVCLVCAVGVSLLPQKVFALDEDIRYSGTDFGRAKSYQAAYEGMFNAHRLYEICGLYQTAAKDLYSNVIYPLTPGYVTAQRQSWAEIEDYFRWDMDSSTENAMTGILKDKNVVLVLMESMDDWMIGSFTPTISQMMEEGISFSNFYTPPYGGVRTFNTEFCINTGSFLSSQGGYALDYVTNGYSQSLANQLKKQGYSTKLFHYNNPEFYSRNLFSKALGYEEYVFYEDYLGDVSEEEARQLMYDDCLLFDNPELNGEFFREGKTLNFVITRSAHLSYRYNEVLSHWGLKKYPGFRGLTWNEETDCALLKAKLVDDFFARLLEELEQNGQLHNTAIIAVTDHYTYGYKDTENLLMLSGVTEQLLLEKTPLFVWYPDCEPIIVEKTLNTSDFLPTVLNLLGISSEYDYIGHDAFDPGYQGFVPFSDGSWIWKNTAYDTNREDLILLEKNTASFSEDQIQQMTGHVQKFIKINNLILETDYYR